MIYLRRATLLMIAVGLVVMVAACPRSTPVAKEEPAPVGNLPPAGTIPSVDIAVGHGLFGPPGGPNLRARHLVLADYFHDPEDEGPLTYQAISSDTSVVVVHLLEVDFDGLPDSIIVDAANGVAPASSGPFADEGNLRLALITPIGGDEATGQSATVTVIVSDVADNRKSVEFQVTVIATDPVPMSSSGT